MLRIACLSLAAFVCASTTIATAQERRNNSRIKWPDCYCTDSVGARHELGAIICLTVGGRSFEAKCVMAQNNPFWRDLDRGCAAAEAPPMTPIPAQVAFAAN